MKCPQLLGLVKLRVTVPRGINRGVAVCFKGEQTLRSTSTENINIEYYLQLM